MESHNSELNALARKAARQRRLPAGAACGMCGTTSHLVRLSDDRIFCYQHRRAEAGARAFEEDHFAGRDNLGGLVVRLRPNDHRTVTELRLQLGFDHWPPAAGDPLLIMAAFLDGLASLLLILARWLRELAAEALARLGPSGWDGAPEVPIVP